MNNLKKYIIIILLFLLPSLVYGESANICNKEGYTVLTINGIFTNKVGASENKRQIEDRLGPIYNNEPLTVNYLLNPSHLGGIGDVTKAVYQKIFDNETVADYDLLEMIDTASKTVTTQKILLVAHSQGNFYANSFYDYLALQGDTANSSVAVYGIASPSGRVAGGGQWITSDTDTVIAGIVARTPFRNIMPPNTHIVLQPDDDPLGHNLSDIYLKHRSKEIVAGIQQSLDGLKSDSSRDPQKPCITAPDLTLLHKVTGAVFAVADPLASANIFVISKTIHLGYVGAKFVVNSGVWFVRQVGSLGMRIVQTVGNVLNVNKASALFSGQNNDPVPDPEQQEVVNGVTENNNVENEIVIVETPDPVAVVTETPENGPSAVQITPVLPVPKIVYPGFGGGGGGGSPSVSSDPIVVATSTPPTPVTPLLPDTTAPVMSITGDNPVYVKLNSIYVDSGATATDDRDGSVAVVASSTVDTAQIGSYVVDYTSTDIAGNMATTSRQVIVVANLYIPEGFGVDSQGRDWQVWEFNGSYVYDWSHTYVNDYLHERFVIKAMAGTYCSQCLQRGIFSTNPLQGFSSSQVALSGLEGNPQNNMNNTEYVATIQWDANGYTYTITHGTTTDTTGYTTVPNITENTWVGWDGSYNNFTTFPSAVWFGVMSRSPMSRTGGGSMILDPYPVIQRESVCTGICISLPTTGPLAGDGLHPTRGRANLTQYDFNVIITDTSGTPPRSVTLHVHDVDNNSDLPGIAMQPDTTGTGVLYNSTVSDGEMYSISREFASSTYEYYFSAENNSGQIVRIPEIGHLRFTSIPSTYTYIPEGFGVDSQGRDWQAWEFNGSYVYAWANKYVDHYLREEFKIRANRGTYCSQCLERGIFNHNPQKGFESYDVRLSGLESNPQNSMNDVTYDVFIQWDAGGYQYIISHGVIVDASGYTPISDISENTWVGWDGSYNHFTTFPSAIWFGALPPESFGLTGGGSMILKPYPVYDPTAPSVSSQKKITSFSLDNLVPPVVGVIDDTLHTISVSVPYGTDVTALTPTIQISDGAQILPATTTARDFTSPILYTVSAEDGLSQSYTVAVIIASDTTAPVVTEYTLNTVAGDITVNPLSTPVTLTIKTNENVNWDSIKIEHTTDADVYKSLRSGAGCVDGSMVCTKVWDGTVSKSGTVLLDGQYRVKLHVRDMVGNDFFDYLSPYTITVDQGL